MSRNDDVANQFTLLNTYRRNLQMYLRQVASLGPAQITTGQQNGIRESRDNIARIKSAIRNWNYIVDDHPDDFEPVTTGVETTSIPAGAKVTIEFENNTKILVMPDAVYKLMQKMMNQDYGVDISEFVVAE